MGPKKGPGAGEGKKGPGPNGATEDDMKHECWGVCLEGLCKNKCAHQMGAPDMWCKENCGECMRCVKASHKDQMERDGHQVPQGGEVGTNTCDCGDGTMTCACTGLPMPPPQGDANQGSGDADAMNVCDCGNGEMTCACVATAALIKEGGDN